jgi:hypothetical protein
VSFLGFFLAIIAAIVAFRFWQSGLRLKQAELIRTYRWPRGLLVKLMKEHNLGRKEAALVSRGLRQFFIAYLMSGCKQVSMPSKIADALWHEFILYTRDYETFCRRALGGYMHHTPAVVLKPQERRDNEGLRRTWWYTCKYESIDPNNPTRLPLLFALDSKLSIPDGYYYTADCEDLRRRGIHGGQCGGDFSNASIDGSTDGFGDSGGGGESGGGDGGCSGGCGGGD